MLSLLCSKECLFFFSLCSCACRARVSETQRKSVLVLSLVLLKLYVYRPILERHVRGTKKLERLTRRMCLLSVSRKRELGSEQ